MAIVTYAALDAALARAKVGADAAGLHGSVTGYFCGGGNPRGHDLLAVLALEHEGGGEDLHALVDAVAREVVERLEGGQAVSPLLPPAALAVRANCTVDWCRGFLGGIGLAGHLADATTQGRPVRALLDDFARIAERHLHSRADDGPALASVLRFIEAGTAQLHAAFAARGGA